MAEPSFQGFCHGYIIITLILVWFKIHNNKQLSLLHQIENYPLGFKTLKNYVKATTFM